jgi:hypothetical protein
MGSRHPQQLMGTTRLTTTTAGRQELLPSQVGVAQRGKTTVRNVDTLQHPGRFGTVCVLTHSCMPLWDTPLLSAGWASIEFFFLFFFPVFFPVFFLLLS